MRDAQTPLSGASFTTRTETSTATEALGESWGRILEPGDLVLLTGDLGAGKTTLVRGLARGLEVTAPVKSPTFALRLDYPGRVTLHHLDLYRIERPDEFDELGFDDCFGPEGVGVVEWGERLGVATPAWAVRVVISEESAPSIESPETPRVLTVIGPGPVVRRLAVAARVDPRAVLVHTGGSSS